MSGTTTSPIRLEGPPAIPAPSTVWIVDDSPLEAEMARQALGSEFSTRVFMDGSTFLEQISQQPLLPDVVLLDWVMPGIAGIEVCQFLRAHPHNDNVSILLLTVLNQTKQIVAGLDAGANDYLCKPYSSAELLARVGSLIRAKRLRERAEQAERSLLTLLTQLPEALITTTGSGRITFLNAEAERILATPTETVIERHVGDLFPSLAKIHEERADGALFYGLPDFEVGSRVYAPAVRRMMTDGVPSIALTLRDVTEKRNLENRRLDFYSMVAHDLRAPLSAMKLRVALMGRAHRGPLFEDYRPDLKRVDAQIGELVTLVNDFLEIARSDGVGLPLATRPVDLVSLVLTTVGDFAELAVAGGVKIHFEETTAPLEIIADPARLKQAIANLISNAVKFSPKGSQVLIEVARRGPQAEFAVSDAGRGIAADKIPELFQRYSRPVTDPALPGTGLGLMIVREIVAAHSGTCGVQSTVGKGSRFWFVLPLVPGPV